MNDVSKSKYYYCSIGPNSEKAASPAKEEVEMSGRREEA